jgi:ribonucleotide reductase alpha subunit
MKRKADGQLDLIPLVPMQAEAALVAKSHAITAQPEPNPQQVTVLKRDGTSEGFNKSRITVAIESAFKAVREIPADAPMAETMSEIVTGLAEKISKRIFEAVAQGRSIDVEYIQDAVETQLMCDGYLTEARRYILYREDRRKLREQTPGVAESPSVTPDDEKLGAHLLLKVIYSESISESFLAGSDTAANHKHGFSYAIQDAIHNDQLASGLLMFDLEQLSEALQLDRDQLITREGLEWLYANCLARDCDRCVETPQYFWMRIAMAFAANEEDDKEARALEFYEILSTLRFLPSEKLLRTCGRSAVISSGVLAETEDIDVAARIAGHVNLAAHVQNGAINELLLCGTISSAIRLLDNAVESTREQLSPVTLHAREYRDIALGVVGYEKALESLSILADSPAALEFTERAAESVAYYSTLASVALAAERGSFPAYADSNWNIGVLPFESLNLSQAGSGSSPAVNCAKDWLAVRVAIRQHGMRNGRILALTPAHILEKLICDTARNSLFSAQLNRLVRCRKWVDGRVWITLPEYLAGPDLEQAYLLAQQLGIRPFVMPVRVTISEPFTDAAAATKVLKGIEKSA